MLAVSSDERQAAWRRAAHLELLPVDPLTTDMDELGALERTFARSERLEGRLSMRKVSRRLASSSEEEDNVDGLKGIDSGSKAAAVARPRKRPRDKKSKGKATKPR